jgi:hypothetical protein
MEGRKVLSLMLEQDLEFYRPIRFPGDVETETKPGFTLLRLQGVRGHFKALEELKRIARNPDRTVSSRKRFF